MLTDEEIHSLLAMPKRIEGRDPARGFREEAFQRRCNFDLRATDSGGERFEVFVRQNTTFIENFSVGLRYHTGDPLLGTVTLARYNGPHGEYSRGQEGHFARPHIHRVTENELKRGSRQPRESERELTDRYQTLEQALQVFFREMGIVNPPEEYFATQLPFPDVER